MDFLKENFQGTLIGEILEAMSKNECGSFEMGVLGAQYDTVVGEMTALEKALHYLRDEYEKKGDEQKASIFKRMLFENIENRFPGYKKDSETHCLELRKGGYIVLYKKRIYPDPSRSLSSRFF